MNIEKNKINFITDLTTTLLQMKYCNTIIFKQTDNGDIVYKEQYQDEFNEIHSIIEYEFDKNFK